MAFYAGRVIREPAMNNPTLVILTDRNDLDDQLFGTFSRCQDLLRQPPVQAESRGQNKGQNKGVEDKTKGTKQRGRGDKTKGSGVFSSGPVRVHPTNLPNVAKRYSPASTINKDLP